MSVQQYIQLQQRLVIQFFLHGKDIVFNHIALNDNHCQQLPGIHPGKLDEFQFAALCLRSGNHGGILGILCKNPGHMLQKRLNFVLALQQHLLHFPHLHNFPFLFLHHGIHIKAVAFVRRDPARGSVGLENIPHFLQISHLVPNGCRAQVQVGVLGNGSAANRFPGLQVIADDRLQDFSFSLIQLHPGCLPFCY